MKRHEVTEAEMDKWLAAQQERWHEFARSYGNGSEKELYIKGDLYRVVDHGATINIGAVKATAIREYNSRD